MALKKPAAKPLARPAGKPNAAKGGPQAGAGAKALPPTVTLKQIAAQLAESQSMAKGQAEQLMGSMVGLFVEHLKAGDRVRIGGLGILEVKNRPARAGRNPANGEPIQIAASKKVTFRPAKELKEAV